MRRSVCYRVRVLPADDPGKIKLGLRIFEDMDSYIRYSGVIWVYNEERM